MTIHEEILLKRELKDLCRTNILRTDEETRQANERKREICDLFGRQFPEDVLDPN